MFFGTNGCMYCSGDCTRECIEPIKPMSRKQNARILTDLLEYLKEEHSYLPSHVFETLGEVIDDLKR
jgi:predicted HicB family RNase H-like nuclease